METDVQKQFIEAIKNNQPEEVERLIKEGADVDANCGEALDIATQLNHNKVAHLLLEHDAFIHNSDTLQTASANGNIELMDTYIAHARQIGDPFNWASKGEALAAAAGAGQLEAVNYLVVHKADINYMDDRPLSRAAAKGHLKVVKYLLINGADLKADKNEALRNAKKYKQQPVIEYLEDYITRLKKHSKK